MTKYRKQFALHLRDIDLIETALRSELSRCAKKTLTHGPSTPANTERAKEINQLLAKIYHQKVFYSQVNVTGIPGG
ncbi:MAG: hypothetical protein HYX63_19290 [Gammaproteobacteria bacterium]|nr:hypothetical protein [Gammaproteobacteria bacterium]